MGKSLQLSLKPAKPSLFKGPFRYSKKKTITSDDGVPDLAISSCASDQESKKPIQLDVPQETTAHLDGDETETDSIPFIQQANNNNDDKHNTSDSNTSDLLFAMLKQEGGITADREQRLFVQNCIPANIVLLPDYDYVSSHDQSEGEEDSQCTSEESSRSSSSLQDRLDHAEALIRSYQSTIRSNEHLIDSLHRTIAKTQEEAMNVMSSYKDLDKEVEILLQEREAFEIVQEPQVYLKLIMGFSLMLYFFGFTTEYPLIATVVVFLMEGFL